MSRSRLPRLLGTPPTGWASLVLLLGMLAVVGLAVADARPLRLAGQEQPALPLVALVAAGAVGFLLGRSRLGPVRAHLLGALVAASVLLLGAAAATPGGVGPVTADLGGLRDGLVGLSLSVEEELTRFLGAAREPPVTLTYLALGALCWATGQFSAFSVFRYRRGGPAIAASGTLLCLNELLPAPGPAVDRLPILLLLAAFALLAMLLLVRLQLTAQGVQWSRRQIADSGEVRRLFLRTGSAFVVLAVLGATSLTAVATVPPQRLESGALQGPLDDLREAIADWLLVLAVDVGPGHGTSLDDRLEVADEWRQGEGLAFVADVPEGGLRGNYWWLSAFADFDGRAWSRDETTSDEVPAGGAIEVPSDASGAGTLLLTATVTPHASELAAGTVVAPSEVVSVDHPVRVRSLGDREGLAEITFADELLRGASYTATSAAYDYAAEDGLLTAAALRSAGKEYPSWIARYLRIDSGASGPRTRELAGDVADEALRLGLDNDYDRARLLQDRLRGLDYRTSVVGRCRPGENVPECLLESGVGFCQHFASTMVMALREMDIPSRFVSGYLPGVAVKGGRYEVPLQALHAWVEVYFPGFGWVRFDPTPGQQLRRFEQRATELPEGDGQASPTSDASGAPLPSLGPEPTTSPSPSPGLLPVLPAPGDAGPLGPWLLPGAGILVAVLLLAGGLLLVRLRRLPGGDGALAWARIAGLAERLGHGPHPAQTEYEFAAQLSRALPSVRDDLYVVADARVEQRYGRRGVTRERQGALRRAYARIRTALLRLGWGRRR